MECVLSEIWSEVLGVDENIAEAATCQMEHGISPETAQSLHVSSLYVFDLEIQRSAITGGFDRVAWMRVGIIGNQESVYAEVYGDGTGIVEFARQKDASYAVEKLDNTKFKSHEVRTIL